MRTPMLRETSTTIASEPGSTRARSAQKVIFHTGMSSHFSSCIFEFVSFTRECQEMGIPYADHIMNAVVLTAA